MTIFYCVQIEKSAHGKILSCEATNGGEADTSQKVSRNYLLRGPALHMDHWSMELSAELREILPCPKDTFTSSLLKALSYNNITIENL